MTRVSIHQRRDSLLGAILLAALSISFLLSYWNRFVAPTSAGAFFYVAEEILAGRVPYRDFFFIVPPLHALKLAAILHLFGHTFAATRVEAMFERVLLSLIVYFWLSRVVRSGAAFAGTLLALVVFCGDSADALASYHHDSVFWAVLSGFAASFVLRSQLARARLAAFLSGSCAGLCLMTKQTTGLGILVCIPVAMIFVLVRSARAHEAKPFVVLYLGGCLAPVLAVTFWLKQNGALAAFFDCVFASATSKGSGWRLLLRPVIQMPMAFTLASILVGILVFLTSHLKEQQLGAPWGVWASSAVGTVSVIALGGFNPLAVVSNGLRPIVILGSLVGALVILCCVVGARVMRPKDQELTLIAAVSVTIAYMLSLSWAAYEPMVMPGLAVVVAVALDRGLASGTVVRWSYTGAFGLMLAGGVAAKLQLPFGWLGWMEAPVREATAIPTLGHLKGLRVSPATLEITERVTRSISEHSRPGDSLLAYPYLPAFYTLSGLRPPTFAFVHYIDVAPDSVSKRDAEALPELRPKFILELDLSAGRQSADEEVFRQGRQSGSRLVMEAIRSLTPSYRLLESVSVPGSGDALRLWARD